MVTDGVAVDTEMKELIDGVSDPEMKRLLSVERDRLLHANG
jgi:hypothetical protein